MRQLPITAENFSAQGHQVEEMPAWTWHDEKNFCSGIVPRKVAQAFIAFAMKALDRQHDRDAS
jgi:hypothetical protein